MLLNMIKHCFHHYLACGTVGVCVYKEMNGVGSKQLLERCVGCFIKRTLGVQHCQICSFYLHPYNQHHEILYIHMQICFSHEKHEDTLKKRKE